jgi:hypothetical protein
MVLGIPPVSRTTWPLGSTKLDGASGHAASHQGKKQLLICQKMVGGSVQKSARLFQRGHIIYCYKTAPK